MIDYLLLKSPCRYVYKYAGEEEKITFSRRIYSIQSFMLIFPIFTATPPPLDIEICRRAATDFC